MDHLYPYPNSSFVYVICLPRGWAQSNIRSVYNELALLSPVVHAMYYNTHGLFSVVTWKHLHSNMQWRFMQTCVTEMSQSDAVNQVERLVCWKRITSSPLIILSVRVFCLLPCFCSEGYKRHDTTAKTKNSFSLYDHWTLLDAFQTTKQRRHFDSVIVWRRASF